MNGHALPASDRRAYRRGQVLGFTVAEFFLLLSFLLLLALVFVAKKVDARLAILVRIEEVLKHQGVDKTAEQVLQEIEEGRIARDRVQLVEEELTRATEERLRAENQAKQLTDLSAAIKNERDLARKERDAALSSVQRFQPVIRNLSGMNEVVQDDFIELVRKMAEEVKTESGASTRELSSLLDDRAAIQTVRQIAEQWTESNAVIADELEREFGDNVENWKAGRSHFANIPMRMWMKSLLLNQRMLAYGAVSLLSRGTFEQATDLQD